MEFHNPTLDKITKEIPKANTTSSMDLKELSSWSNHFKYQKPGSLQQ